MSITYVLVMAFALSAVLGTPTPVTYGTEHQIQFQKTETAVMAPVTDRLSNLKYVMTIQSSKIWSEIKKRSLTINTQPIAGIVDEKSPNDLSNQELMQLKQVCHDGLKCVAVDQLLMLQKVRAMDHGKVSVRMAITKITRVITLYTTEYHEDVYEYTAVQQTDDPSKVFQSVTTIVEDNKELCRLNINPQTVEVAPHTVDVEPRKDDEKPPKNGDGNGDPAVEVENGTVKFNLVKNYNINNGTINSATIEMHPSDTAESLEKSSDPDSVTAVAPQTTTDHQSGPVTNNTPGSDSETKKQAQQTGSTIVDDYAKYASTGGNGSADVGTDNNGGERKDRQPRPDTDKVENGGNNFVELKNGAGSGGGVNDADSDIVSAGDHNQHEVRKGLVEDGYLNNGNMKVDSYDDSNRNKGTIKNCNADHGIINVGTVNNGPVNYGTNNEYTNNGTTAEVNNLELQQYVSSIDQIYSRILNEFAKN